MTQEATDIAGVASLLTLRTAVPGGSGVRQVLA